MATGGDIKNLVSLTANNEQFEVPDFQRNYSWEPKQAEELFLDILEARKSGAEHFLGSLIIHRLVDGQNIVRRQVVDGQQRLTTLFLLIAIIRDASHKLSVANIPDPNNQAAPIEVTFQAQALLFVDGPSLRFVPHPLVASMISSMIFAFPDPNRPLLPKKHFNYSLALRKTYRKLQGLLSAELRDLENDEARLRFLNGLLGTIKTKLKMLEVSTDSHTEAYEIFMTLNSRGLPLGPSDLVKSELFKHLTHGLTGPQFEIKSANLTGDWKAILDNLENGDIDQYLRHYVVSTQEGSTTAKKLYDKVLKTLKGTVENPKDPRVTSIAFLNEMLSSSAVYGSILNGKLAWLNNASENQAQRNAVLSLRLLADLSDSYRIFLLPVCDPRTALADQQRLELIRLTEVLAFRWVIGGLNAQTLEDNFQKFSLALRGGSSYSDVVAMISAAMPLDTQIVPEFEEVIESATLVRTVLFRINRAKWDTSGTIAYSTSSFHVEHIAPDKPTEHWLGVLFPNDSSNRDVEYDSAVELWGNKTLLDWKINLGLKQKPYADKANGVEAQDGDPGFLGYRNSTFDITSDLGVNIEDWDRDVIALRNQWVADCFVKVYAVTERIPEVKGFSDWRTERMASGE